MLWYIKLYIFTANPNIYRVLSDHIAIPTPRMLTIAAGQSKKISSPWWQLFLLGHKKTEGFFNHETFQVKSGSGSWFKGSEDQPFSQGTRMQAKKISNFTDFTWEQIQIQNLQTLRGSNITHEKTWMKVGQTCKTRICQSLSSASKSHSRHLFVESMSGPWPYRWDFNRLPVLNWSYRILARLSWSCLFWWGPSCNWSHILLQVSPTRTPSITPGSLFSPCTGEPGYQGNCSKLQQTQQGFWGTETNQDWTGFLSSLWTSISESKQVWGTLTLYSHRSFHHLVSREYSSVGIIKLPTTNTHKNKHHHQTNEKKHQLSHTKIFFVAFLLWPICARKLYMVMECKCLWISTFDASFFAAS